MSNLILKVKRLDERARIPTVGNPDDACFDLYALEDMTFKPGEIRLVRTGLAIEPPIGYRSNIYVRSSTPIKKGYILANGVGVIDHGYRGELLIQLMNVSTKVVYFYESENGHQTEEPQGVFIGNTIERGDKIGQFELLPTLAASDIRVYVVDDLSPTERGTGGIGSTGG
jgi:dUTP pyrophosphatase